MTNRTRWFFVILLSSLVANAYLGGVLLGRSLEEQAERKQLETERKVTVGEITDSIPDLQKQKFRNANEWLLREVQAQIDEIRAKRAQSMQVLTAEQFNRDEFDRIEDEIIDIRQSIFRKRKNMVGFLAQDLSLEDRKRLAATLQKSPRKADK